MKVNFSKKKTLHKSNDSKVIEKYSLEKQFKEYIGPNLTKNFTWDKNKGKEMW